MFRVSFKTDVMSSVPLNPAIPLRAAILFVLLPLSVSGRDWTMVNRARGEGERERDRDRDRERETERERERRVDRKRGREGKRQGQGEGYKKEGQT